MFDFLFDIHQQARIDEIGQTVKKTEQTTGDVREEVKELEKRVDRLALLSQALWELLRTHSDVTDVHLRAKIDEIDRRDGRKDGKISPMLSNCPKCGKPMNCAISGCAYCGGTNPRQNVFKI